jgi:hypothetical protein
MNILNNIISYKKTKPKWKYKVFLNFENWKFSFGVLSFFEIKHILNSCLPSFPNCSGWVINFFSSFYVNLIDTYFEHLQTLSSIVAYLHA